MQLLDQSTGHRFVSQSELKRAGLSAREILALGEPDKLAPNPHPHMKNKMKLYDVDARGLADRIPEKFPTCDRCGSALTDYIYGCATCLLNSLTDWEREQISA